MTLFASLSLGCALPPLAALATLSSLPAASAALGLSETLLGRHRCRRAAVVQRARHRLIPVAACRNNLTPITCWSRSVVAPCACQGAA